MRFHNQNVDKTGTTQAAASKMYFVGGKEKSLISHFVFGLYCETSVRVSLKKYIYEVTLHVVYSTTIQNTSDLTYSLEVDILIVTHPVVKYIYSLFQHAIY